MQIKKNLNTIIINSKTKFQTFIDEFLLYDTRCNKDPEVIDNIKLVFPIQQQILMVLNTQLQYAHVKSFTINANNIIQIFKLQGIMQYQKQCIIDLYVEDNRLILPVIYYIITQPYIQENYTLITNDVVHDALSKQKFDMNVVSFNVEQLFNTHRFGIDTFNIYFNNYKIELVNINTNQKFNAVSPHMKTSITTIQQSSAQQDVHLFEISSNQQNIVTNYVISLLQKGIPVMHANKQKYLYLASTTAYLILTNQKFNHEQEIYINVKLTKKVFPIEHIFDILCEENQYQNITLVLSKLNIYTQRLIQIKQQLKYLEQCPVSDCSDLDYNQDVRIPDSHYFLPLQLCNDKNSDIPYLIMDCFRILQDRPTKYPEVLLRQYLKIQND